MLSHFSYVPLFCDPMECSLPSSCIHGILLASILAWVAMASSRGSSWPREWTCISYVSCIGRQVLYHLHHLGSLIWLTYIMKSEKAMAPHYSTLAWKIPCTEEPGGLQSMGSQRVGHDWAISLSLFTFMHWRRKWQPTPVFLPGESQGQRSPMGCPLWGRTESDRTEAT